MDHGDRTIAAYDARMDAYLAAQRAPAPHVTAWMERFVGALPGPRVLELGSGPGTDADRLEALGARVQRSDATPAFVERLRDLGHAVLRLDVRRDPLPAALDGVFANAVLLHLERDELADALLGVHGALVPGGVLACSVKEGDGEVWSERKLGLPRRFVLWREAPLRTALVRAGFEVRSIDRGHGDPDDWLHVLAVRRSLPAAAGAPRG